jgi:glycosyltransferase involved in cell wall biosynthesis
VPVHLSIVIPSYNEGSNVIQVVDHATSTLSRLGHSSAELLLVNDGSSDDTGNVMDTLALSNSAIRVFHHPRNAGLGAALRTGFQNARGSIITWIPGDGQFDLAEVLAGLQQMPPKDCVVAIRQGRNEAARSFISSCFHGMIRILFQFDATDVCGIWLIERDVLEQIRPQASDIFLNLEIPLLCVRHRKSLGRITVSIQPRLSGTSKVTNLRTMAKNLYELLKFRFTL